MTETAEDIAAAAAAMASGKINEAPPDTAAAEATEEPGVSPQPDRVPLEPMPHGKDLVTEGGVGPHAGYPGAPDAVPGA